MRTSTTAMGLMGGVALALALVAPLYVGLPSNYVNDWMYMTPGGGQIGVVLAGLVLLGTGFLAGALTPSDAIRAGAGASLVASLLGATWMLSPGITVGALSDLLVVTDAVDPNEVVGLTLNRVLWYPATATLGLLASGPGLGALGGITFDLWQAEPSRPLRVMRPSPVPFVGMLAVTGWGAALVYLWAGSVAQLELLDTPIGPIKVAAAPAILGLWTTLFLCWALRDSVLWFRGRKQLRGVVWALGAVALGLLTLTPLAYYPELATSPVVMGVAGGALLLAMVTLIVTGRANVALDNEPRRIGDLLVEATFVGVLTVGLGLLTVGPLLISEQLILRSALEALASQDPLSVDTLTVVKLLFRYHWLSLIPMAVVAGAWTVLRLPTMWMHQALEG